MRNWREGLCLLATALQGCSTEGKLPHIDLSQAGTLDRANLEFPTATPDTKLFGTVICFEPVNPDGDCFGDTDRAAVNTTVNIYTNGHYFSGKTDETGVSWIEIPTHVLSQDGSTVRRPYPNMVFVNDSDLGNPIACTDDELIPVIENELSQIVYARENCPDSE